VVQFQRRYRNQEVRAAQLESRLIEAELKVLREQLKPHFLFNTLNTDRRPWSGRGKTKWL
jgi:LytS/YehU family sensor histidine kinase